MTPNAFRLPLATCLVTLAVLAACSRQEQAAVDAAATAPAATGGSPETRPANNSAFQPAFEGQTRAPGLQTSVALDVQVKAEGLEGPWAFEFLPDGRLLVTERPGRMRIVGTDGTLSEPVAGLPAVLFEGQGGLLDVALDPGFETNRTVWWTYSEARDDGNGTTLARGVLEESGGTARLRDVAVVFRQQPGLRSGLHFGSRIVFAPDGQHLFVGLGERGIPEGRVQSQDLASHFGKVIRLRLDGSVPADNPFVGQAGAKPEIWSYGHRNIQAATLDPQGRLWTIEHGPRGGDELNRPEPGKNYGWPVIGYGIDYSGATMHEANAAEGLEQPVYYWDPVIAPSGALFYSGRLVPEWSGDLFVGGLGSNKLVRLKLENDRVVGEEWLLGDRGSRFRDVKEAPDGSLWLLADNAVLRVAPAGAGGGG